MQFGDGAGYPDVAALSGSLDACPLRRSVAEVSSLRRRCLWRPGCLAPKAAATRLDSLHLMRV
jgi:hypothetical protein